MTIAMPELILDEFLDIEEACQHRKHNIDTAWHSGAAAYWMDFLCPNCGKTTRGYRCEQWSHLVMAAFSNIQCNEHCGASCPTFGNVHFTRLHGAA